MAATAAETKRIRLDRIRTDGTQTRTFNPVVASEYAAAMSAGAKFPPAVVFFDGTDYWMSCGHHRLEASKMVEAKTIECDVREGAQFEALCFAFRDNDTHGLRVTNEDKRFRTRLALERPECEGWSDRRIAELVGVSYTFVGTVRKELSTVDSSKPRNGTKTCPNCGGHEFTDDGDCAKCYEPCGEADNATLFDGADESDEETDEESEPEPEVRVGIDGKKRRVKKNKAKAKAKDEPKPFDSDANCMALFDYLRSLATKWPMQYRESLSKVLSQMSREVLTIPEASK